MVFDLGLFNSGVFGEGLNDMLCMVVVLVVMCFVSDMI